MLAGLSKAVPFEVPEIEVVRVYTAGGGAGGGNAAAVAAAALATGETDVDVDDEAPVVGGASAKEVSYSFPRAVRYAARPVSASASAALALKPNQSLLVTGWTGGLGTEVVRALAAPPLSVPAERIVLLARRAAESPVPGCRVAVAAEPGSAAGVRAALRAAGVQAGESLGVLHLAGALRDGVLQNQTEETLAVPVDAKVRTLQAVLEAAAGDVSFLLSFSSTSSLFGYPGQSNYCAANGYLDAFTRAGAAGGLRVATVSWGPWGEVGMAREGTKAHALAVKEGDTPLKTAPALAALGNVLRSLVDGTGAAGVQYAVCDLDVERSPWGPLPVLRELMAEAEKKAEAKAKKSTSGAEAAAAEPAGDASATLRQWIAKEVGYNQWEEVVDEV